MLAFVLLFRAPAIANLGYSNREGRYSMATAPGRKPPYVPIDSRKAGELPLLFAEGPALCRSLQSEPALDAQLGARPLASGYLLEGTVLLQGIPQLELPYILTGPAPVCFLSNFPALSDPPLLLCLRPCRPY